MYALLLVIDASEVAIFITAIPTFEAVVDDSKHPKTMLLGEAGK
jgi:hypothetical protein